MQVPFNAWNTTSSTVCVALDGSLVQDTYGSPFPASENCTTLNHRSDTSRLGNSAIACLDLDWQRVLQSMSASPLYA